MLQGVWLPIITPFQDDQVDYDSYQKLIEHYLNQGISGLIPLGTTGESPTVCEAEFEAITAKTVEIVNGRVPIFVGAGGNCTKKVINQIKAIEKYRIDGILSVCPYYNRPDQKGIYQHFQQLSEATDLKIIVYNIPYRTGRNIENDTLRKLAELKNIIGVKDSCGDIKQSMDLLINRPAEFSILTGEDILYYSTLALGGDGGILAAAHIKTKDYVEIYDLIKADQHQAALEKWKPLTKIIPLLFKEPNPAPIKYYLKKSGMISSSEIRLPLIEISPELAEELEGIGGI